MLTLNIIPPELKKEIKFKHLTRSINLVIGVITCSVLTYTIILGGCRIFLNSYYQEISSQNVLVTKNTDNYSKQIKEINKQISSIETAQKDSITWPPLLAVLFNNIPGDIKLNSVSFDKNGNKLNINGIAGTRDSLIELRKYLENNKNFSLASFPVQSLIEKQNINFDISLTINSYSPQT
jgi:Tfp pilus assembly protein PilN